MGNPTNHKKKLSQRDYSLTFKLQFIRELERGELTFSQANKKYGIQGHITVTKWLSKYSILDWKELPVVIHKKTPEQKIKELEVLI